MKRRNGIVDWLVYAGVRLFAMIAHMFPIDVNLRTARLLGWIWYRTMRRHRDRATANLEASFGPAMSPARRERVALKSMQQMAMMAMEVLFVPRLISEWTWPRYIRVRDLGEVLDILLDRRGVIMLTGHYGNWELLGFALGTLGFDLVAVMRPLDNPHLNRYVMETRERRGLQLLYKKGATRSAQEILADGGIVCFIADQNAGRKGLFVDFFGRKASTYKSIGLLAMDRRAPIVVGYARRVSPRFEYEIGVNRVIRPEEWEPRDDPLKWITQEYTRAIEDFVREDPDQYLWVHRRWKSRPRDEKKDGMEWRVARSR